MSKNRISFYFDAHFVLVIIRGLGDSHFPSVPMVKLRYDAGDNPFRTNISLCTILFFQHSFANNVYIGRRNRIQNPKETG